MSMCMRSWRRRVLRKKNSNQTLMQEQSMPVLKIYGHTATKIDAEDRYRDSPALLSSSSGEKTWIQYVKVYVYVRIKAVIVKEPSFSFVEIALKCRVIPPLLGQYPVGDIHISFVSRMYGTRHGTLKLKIMSTQKDMVCC